MARARRRGRPSRVNILFVGNEEEYDAMAIRGENEESFSLLFCPSLSTRPENVHLDGILIPALRFLASQAPLFDGPCIASGAAHLAEECFDAGCSDFIREPWHEYELQARVKARSGRRLSFDNGSVTVMAGRLSGPSGDIDIPSYMFRTLALFMNNSNRLIPRQALAAIWKNTPENGRAIDMRIARLRSALRRVGAVELASKLRCEHGEYRLSP